MGMGIYARNDYHKGAGCSGPLLFALGLYMYLLPFLGCVVQLVAHLTGVRGTVLDSQSVHILSWKLIVQSFI